MLSATADSNIYISALQFGGVPARFLDLAVESEFRLDISEAIREETLHVLRDKFHWTEADLLDAELLLDACTRPVTPLQTVDVIPAKPSDNRILECAATARSDFMLPATSAICFCLAASMALLLLP